jgi:hypothetical protein
MLEVLLHPLQSFAAACAEKEFFGLPTWYHYLNLAGKMQQSAATGHCEFVSLKGGFKVADLSLVMLAVVDILLRLSALIAIAYIMYGGFRMITAQGDPQGTKAGQQTMFNALIGLGIALAAVGGVAFIGRVLH